MSKLSKRCEERKDEAQALANKYNALIEEQKKLESQRLQIKSEFDMKSAQYAELLSLVQEEESVQTSSEVVE
tara:strand:+ start:4322 stop:4537 length:216 start_codon:yes stop_codon:yes gene_type:complete